MLQTMLVGKKVSVKVVGVAKDAHIASVYLPSWSTVLHYDLLLTDGTIMAGISSGSFVITVP